MHGVYVSIQSHVLEPMWNRPRTCGTADALPKNLDQQVRRSHFPEQLQVPSSAAKSCLIVHEQLGRPRRMLLGPAPRHAHTNYRDSSPAMPLDLVPIAQLSVNAVTDGEWVRIERLADRAGQPALPASRCSPRKS